MHQFAAGQVALDADASLEGHAQVALGQLPGQFHGAAFKHRAGCQAQALVQRVEQVVDGQLALGQDQSVFGAGGEAHVAARCQRMLRRDNCTQAKMPHRQLLQLRGAGQGESQAQVGPATVHGLGDRL
ncbi:hypothetical protein D9M71_334730 [compost metagenome]